MLFNSIIHLNRHAAAKYEIGCTKSDNSFVFGAGFSSGLTGFPRSVTWLSG